MDLRLYLPQMIVVGGGLAVLLTDVAFWPSGAAGEQGRRRSGTLWGLTLAFALAAGLASVWWPVPGAGFSTFFNALFSGVAVLVALLARGYLTRVRLPEAEFYTLLLFSAAGMMTLAGSSHLIVMYLGLELLSQCSYVLSGLAKGDPRSNEASLKYFLIGSVASTVTLFGLVLLYGSTGSFEVGAVANWAKEAAAGAPGVLGWSGIAGAVLLVAGLGVKVGVVPFHMWVPDTYEGAPTPVTALFSVGPKVAGLAALARLVATAFPHLAARWQGAFLLLSLVTMTFGNLVALGQTNVKRMMGYSSIAQAGYLLTALAIPTATGLHGFVFYLAAYVAANLGAFAVITWWGTTHPGNLVADYRRLGATAPWAAAGLTLCFMSLAGIPPTAGFMAKFLLVTAAVQDGQTWFAIGLVLNGVLSVPYYYGVVRQMYFPLAETAGESAPDAHPTRPAMGGAALALGFSVALLLVWGLLPQPLITFLRAAVPR